jgi:hypothetical protein
MTGPELPAPTTFRTGKRCWYTAVTEWCLGQKTEKMPTSQKDQLAAEAMDRWEHFQEGLASVKRKYPISQFRAFWSAQNAMPN